MIMCVYCTVKSFTATLEHREKTTTMITCNSHLLNYFELLTYHSYIELFLFEHNRIIYK